MRQRLQRLRGGRGEGARAGGDPPRHPGGRPPGGGAAPLRGRHPAHHRRAGADPAARDEGERRRVAVGPEEVDRLLHRRETGGLPRPGARPRRDAPRPHRPPPDRGPRRSGAAQRGGPLWEGILLLELAHHARAGEPGARQGPASLAQSGPDLRRMRPAALLPQVRARVLCHRPKAVPEGREDAPRRAGAREGRGGGHFPGAGFPAERRARPPDRVAARAARRALRRRGAAARSAGDRPAPRRAVIASAAKRSR